MQASNMTGKTLGSGCCTVKANPVWSRWPNFGDNIRPHIDESSEILRPVAVAIDHWLLIERLDHFGFLFFGVRNCAHRRSGTRKFRESVRLFLQVTAGCSETYGTSALTEYPAGHEPLA
jgi:hypothetical protein